MNLRAPILIADTSTLLNLYASDTFEKILTSIEIPVCIVENVARETQYILRNGQKEKTVLTSFISNKLLRIVSLESDEEKSSLIEFSREIDDGESATGAIALHRQWDIATDDKKARTIFAREIPQSVCVGTADILHHSAEYFNWDNDTIRLIIQTIQIQARFRPRADGPLAPWWYSFL
jgi:predicted nucleic acid-binding protein